MQVKILKDYGKYKKGEYVSIPVKKAIQLIRTGFAVAHKAIFTGVQK